MDLFVPKERMSDKSWTFIQGDIFRVEEEKFDLIMLNHSLEHMENPREILIHAKTLLKSEGKLMVSVPVVGGG